MLNENKLMLLMISLVALIALVGLIFVSEDKLTISGKVGYEEIYGNSSISIVNGTKGIATRHERPKAPVIYLKPVEGNISAPLLTEVYLIIDEPLELKEVVLLTQIQQILRSHLPKEYKYSIKLDGEVDKVDLLARLTVFLRENGIWILAGDDANPAIIKLAKKLNMIFTEATLPVKLVSPEEIVVDEFNKLSLKSDFNLVSQNEILNSTEPMENMIQVNSSEVAVETTPENESVNQMAAQNN